MKDMIVCTFCDATVNSKMEHCESCGTEMEVIKFVIESTKQEETTNFKNPNYVPLVKMSAFE